MENNTIRVITNNVPRPVIDGWHLTPAERAEFDYVDWAGVETGSASASFIRYRGQLIDLNDGFDVGSVPTGTPGKWDAFCSDSFFSGVVIRYCEDYEYVVVGTLIA